MRQERISSEDTIEVPRSFPPPGHSQLPPVNPPLQLLEENAQESGNSNNEQAAPKDAHTSWPQPQTQNREAPAVSDKQKSKSKNNRTADISKSRFGFDGHNYSSDTDDRGGRYPSPDPDVTLYHFCAKCGRRRSGRFHRDNPIKKGTVPRRGICSRCQPPPPPPPPPSPPSPSQAPRRARSPSPKSRRLPSKSNGKEVEEVLIRRGRGQPRTGPGPVARLFQPLPSKVYRVLRRRRASSSQSNSSSSYDRLRIRSSKSSDSNYVTVVRRSKYSGRAEESQPPAKATAKPPRPNSDSDASVTPGWSSEPPPAPRKPNAHDLIAAHPNPWSHGEMIAVAPPPRIYSNNRDSSPQGPEWYYRRRRTYTGPRASSGDDSFDPEKRISDIERGNASGSDERQLSSSTRRALEKVKNPTKNGNLSRKQAQDRRPPPRPAKQRSSSSSEQNNARPHVKFANPSYGSRAVSREREAVKDKIEEDRDQHKFEQVKRGVRKEVKQKAARMELDGHHSEDQERYSEGADQNGTYAYLAEAPVPDGSSSCSRTSKHEISKEDVVAKGVQNQKMVEDVAWEDETGNSSAHPSTECDIGNAGGDDPAEEYYGEEHQPVEDDQQSQTTEQLNHAYMDASVCSNGLDVSDSWQAEAHTHDFMANETLHNAEETI